MTVPTSGHPSLLARQAIHSVAWLTLAQVARRFSGLAITFVLARLLAPSDYGMLAMATVALGVFAVVSEMGVSTALVQRTTLDERVCSTAFWGALGVSVLVALAGLVLAPLIGVAFDNPTAERVFQAMLLVLPIGGLSQVPDALLQRAMRFKAISAIEWTTSVVSGVVGIAVAYAGGGVWALVAQTLSAALLGLVAKAATARWWPRFTFDRRLAGGLLSFGGFVMGSMILNHVASNMDNAIVGAQLGADALGYYSMAFNLALMPTAIISGLLARVLFPLLSNLQNDPARFRSAYLRTLRSITLLALPTMAAFAALAREAVVLMYGEQWMPSIILLQILCVVSAAQACNLSGPIFFASGRSRQMLVVAAANTGVLSAALWMGSHWGARGVAVAAALGAVSAVSIAVSVANRIIQIHRGQFFSAVAPGLGAGLLVGLTILLLKTSMPDLEPIWVVVATGTASALTYALYLAGWARLHSVPLRSIVHWSTQVS